MRSVKTCIIFLLSFLPISAFATPKDEHISKKDPLPVLIDTDMAFDDWSAILYLLHKPNVRVVGIAVDGTGEAHCDVKSGNVAGAQNALGLIELAGKSSEKIPVTCGPADPMIGNRAFPEHWRSDSDNVFNIKLPTSKHMLQKEDAVELISSVLKNSHEKVHILALGPLTNLGLAFKRDPSLVKHIASIVIMGGAVNVPGNLQATDSTITNNTTAEWNIYIDPTAADIVFRSGAPIQLIALDGTNSAQLTMPFVEKLGTASETKSSKFIYEFLTKERQYIEKGELYFWDSLAAAVVTNHDICEFKKYPLTVITKNNLESGRTKRDPAGTPVDVCVKANGKRFENMFISTVNTQKNKMISSRF